MIVRYHGVPTASCRDDPARMRRVGAGTKRLAWTDPGYRCPRNTQGAWTNAPAGWEAGSVTGSLARELPRSFRDNGSGGLPAGGRIEREGCAFAEGYGGTQTEGR